MIALEGHVALVQPRVGIGDMVWHLPHLRALAKHAARPVTLVARPRSRADQLVTSADGIGDILWVERDQWTPNGRHQGLRGALRLVRELRARRVDTVVLLTRSRHLAFTAAAAGIPARYGYAVGRQRTWLNRAPHLPAAALPLHPYEQAGAWLAAAGIPLPEPEPRIHVDPARTAAARARLGLGPRPPIALGIAASDAWKKWPAPAFVELAQRLLATGAPDLLLLGGASEQAEADAIRAQIDPARTHPVLGWHLQDVAALLAAAALYVGNDTAVLNIAAAVGTRAYGLFGATPVLHHSPNIIPIVPPGGPNPVDGMARLTVDTVLATIEQDHPAIP